MSKQKPYRISISFPPEMAEIIWSIAREDDRPFTWEVVHLLQTFFEGMQKGQNRHMSVLQKVQGKKEA